MHSSVVRIVPAPFTSMAPPSSTTGRSPWTIGRSSASSAFAARSGSFTSFLQFAYLDQPSNRNRAIALPPGRVTQIGPVSRIQPRSVGQRRSWTRSSAMPERWSTRRALFSWAASLTMSRTVSPSATQRTISA